MEDSKVAILLENLMSQFRTFGDGLAMLNEKMDRGFAEVRSDINKLNYRMDNLENRFDKLEGRFDKLERSNSMEHNQIMQMVKELDKEVQTEIKRVK